MQEQFCLMFSRSTNSRNGILGISHFYPREGQFFPRLSWKVSSSPACLDSFELHGLKAIHSKVNIQQAGFVMAFILYIISGNFCEVKLILLTYLKQVLAFMLIADTRIKPTIFCLLIRFTWLAVNDIC